MTHWSRKDSRPFLDNIGPSLNNSGPPLDNLGVHPLLALSTCAVRPHSACRPCCHPYQYAHGASSFHMITYDIRHEPMGPFCFIYLPNHCLIIAFSDATPYVII